MEINEKHVKLIRQSALELKDEITRFLSDFIKIETENPPGNNYLECVQFLGEKMRQLGFSIDYIEVPSEGLTKLAKESQGYPRFIVIGTLNGEENRPVIHFSGHYDVVPAGGGWSLDPYGGVVRENKIYGRGASDMKSGIAAQIMAIAVLKNAGFKLRGAFVSSAVPDEESGGDTGMGWLVSSGRLNNTNTDYCVITEPLDPDKICLGHRGALWFKLKFTGIQSHGSMPSEGLNPIEGMNEFLNRMNSVIKPQLEMVSQYPVNPEKSKKSTLCVTMINSGSKVNTIPDVCEASFDWRLIPEQNINWAKNEVLKICDQLKKENKIISYEFESIHEAEPTIAAEDQLLVDVFKHCGELVLGKKMEINFSPGYDDQRFAFHEGNVKASIVYGPGRLIQAHKSDEHIDIDDLLDGICVMAASTASILGFTL